MVSYRKNARYDFYRSWYSPSNGITTTVVLSRLDLNLQGEKCETLTL